jgi:DNA-binding NarL/FixJ family response regulator
MPKPFHVLIVEDHPLYRDALTSVLGALTLDAGCHLQFSTAASQAEALALLQAHPDIDLVVSDHTLQQGSGLDLLQAVGQRWPTVVRVLMSGTSDAAVCASARRLGLMGYVPKALEPSAFVTAIETVLSGEPWFPADDSSSSGTGRGLLTERQAGVLSCVAAGQSNKQVARSLGISERTIKYHLEGIFIRLEVANRAEAVVTALAKGLIRSPM